MSQHVVDSEHCHFLSRVQEKHKMGLKTFDFDRHHYLFTNWQNRSKKALIDLVKRQRGKKNSSKGFWSKSIACCFKKTGGFFSTFSFTVLANRFPTGFFLDVFSFLLYFAGVVKNLWTINIVPLNSFTAGIALKY
ncbi:hypothetical protein CEXT_675471 [Caerostris extrusa]|uniref:Uncharacterized protein n=1 Tax=Caerostris extrusa TaxID=172846 RepID=A0AAV4XDJ0_CAEEX|nr:hypothetical protein CEXT_675471 [Caerostris extrusa]